MDYSNPNTDFDPETASLLRALKQAEGLRDTRITPTATLQGGRALFGAGPGGTVSQAFDRLTGNLQMPQVEQQQRDLSGEQQRRIAGLTEQLNAPPTDDPIADNQKRTALALEMSRLPQARGLADELFKRTVAFPEKMAELKSKQIEAGNLEAMRLQERERADQRHQETLRMLGIGQQNLQREGLDLKKSQYQDKVEAANQKKIDEEDAYIQSAQHLEGLINELKNTPNMSSATGSIGGRTPFLFSLTPNDKSTAQSRIKNLQEYLQTKGLQDLRRAGVAPGSVTEKEWAKFAARAGNIDPNLDDQSFRAELDKLMVDVQSSMQNAVSRKNSIGTPKSPGAGAGGNSSNMVIDEQTGKAYVYSPATGKWYYR
jgi:hypothetical protein